MRLLTFEKNGNPALGARVGTEVVDLAVAAPELPRSLLDLLHAGSSALDAALRSIDRTRSQGRIAFDQLRLLPPIPRPGKIICVGLNYRDHRAEAGLSEPAKFPGMFHRVNTSLVAHGQPMLVPRVSHQLDFEGELLVIIGRRGHRIAAASALDYVAGYSIFNDGSVRDYQIDKALAAGKNFDATGGFGPELVTADELPPGASGLELTTRLNGQLMQETNTANLIFDVAHVIELVSDIHTLEPGDIISTGTCGGVGAARKPPIYMKPGDVVEVRIEGIGALRNPIAAE